MWQRFTERARRVVWLAQEEANGFGHDYVSAEHLLLGMIREGNHNAAKILEIMGVSREKIRTLIEGKLVKREKRTGSELHLAISAKRSVEMAYMEMQELGIDYIGTEHLLLGLILGGGRVTERILADAGVDLKKTRAEVMNLQDELLLLRASQPTGHDLLRSSAGEEEATLAEELLRGSDKT